MGWEAGRMNGINNRSIGSKMTKNISKISLFLLTFLCMQSCREDNPFGGATGTEKDIIEISGQITQSASARVTETGFADGDAIGVYIVDYVNGQPGQLTGQGNHATNVKFTYDGVANVWEGTAKIYWTDDKTPVDGYSYYPFREVIEDPKNVDFSISARQDRQEETQLVTNYELSDFLWAKANKVAPGQTIALNHTHLMAGVEINLIPGTGFDEATWDEVEKNVLIEQIQPDAKIDLSTGTVTPGEGTPVTVVPYDKGNGTYRAVLIPQSKAAGEILFTLTVDKTSYQFKRENDMTFAGGKLHRFTIEVIQRLPEGDYDFKLTDEAVTAWDDDGISHTGTVREYVVVKSPEKGKLAEALQASGRDLDQLLNLKVVGEMNHQDFIDMRELLPNLEAINLQEVKLRDASLQSGSSDSYPSENLEDDVLPSYAFYCCKSLKYIVYPKEMKKIGEYAFRGAGLVGALEIPEGVTYIATSAFNNWDAGEGAHMYLNSLKLPSTLEYIGETAFRNNKFNCELILPEKLKEIGPYAFQECSYLYGTLNLPSGLEVLGNSAFGNLSRLTGPLVIPAGIKEVSGLAGAGFSSLVLPDGLEVIGQNALGGVGYGGQFEIFSSKISGELYVPETVRNIGIGAFAGLQITHAYLPEGLSEIPRDLFRGCDKLMDTLKIPSTVKQIRSGAFEKCSRLTAIVLPEGLESIGGDNSEYSWFQFSTFGGCYALNLLRCDAKEPPLIIGDVFGDLPKNNFTVQVPAESVEKYRNAEGWKEFKRIAAYSNFVCRPQSANLLNKGHEYNIVLNADGNWKVKSIPGWCSISANSGFKKTELTVTIDELPDGQGNREDSIVFSLDGTEYTTCYYIKQYDSERKEDASYTLQAAKQGKGVNIVLLGDGYDAEDIADGTYQRDMEQAAEHFFGVEPFKTYRNYFNVYTVWAMSAESGIGTLNTLRDTKFDTQYGNFTYDSRIHCAADYAMSYVAEYSPVTKQEIKESLVILIPNSTMYDGVTYMYGDGSALALCPKSELDFPYDARGVIQHEACGHGFTKLADEYIYHRAWIQTCKCTCCAHVADLQGMQASGWGQNLSLSGRYEDVPWYHLIHDARYNDIVDIYDGGYFHSDGVYRSEYNSVMNNNVPYLSTWSRELAVRRIKELAGETFSYEEFVANDSREWGIDFTRSQMENIPASGTMHGAPPVIIKRSPNLNIREK
jgi:hypothetical protein